MTEPKPTTTDDEQVAARESGRVDGATLRILAEGEVRLEGESLLGSNYTFLVRVAHPTGERMAVYKPQRGEQPLWDFPEGTLAAREVAAWLTSERLGWDLVPPTVLRPDGPAGPGSIQLFLDLDYEHHYFAFSPEERARLRPAAAFDLLINNADRKGGHVLRGTNGHIWLIDHGVCFHQEDKLRTVIWDFAGEPIPDPLLADMDRYRREVEGPSAHREALDRLLSNVEIEALAARGRRIVADAHFPFPGPRRPYPWPLV